MPISHLTDLLYPPACLLCHAPLALNGSQAAPPRASLAPAHSASRGGVARTNRLLCDECLEAMPRNGVPFCRRCGGMQPGAFDAVIECASCRRHPLAFDHARAPWHYLGPARDAVRQFKYHHRWRLGRWLAEEMAHLASRTLPIEAVGAVVPIPRHWLKQRLQGCHPASELAHRVANTLDKPYAPRGLRRVRWTSTQTRLPWPQRFRNVHRAFRASRAMSHHHTVLLIDDVFTSGATAHTAALALKDAGVRCVLVLTATRTPFL